MTTVPGEITADARQVRFGRVLLTITLGIFWGLGYLAGRAWLGAVMCAFAVRRGWRDGTGWVPEPGGAHERAA